jgi:surfeit locus 1 family protein
VYTPFVESGGQTLLVNRGWLPLPAGRTPLPVVETPEEALTVKGRLGPMPTPGRQLGRALDPESNRWPQLVTYPSIERTGRALGLDLYPWVLFLDADSPGGFAGRDWRPVYMSPQKHQAYAFQWLTLAALALSCWVVTGVRRMETT